MRGIDTEMVLRLVAENAKQRFELFYGYDPSSPRPKVKKPQGQGEGKGKGKGKGKGQGNGQGQAGAGEGNGARQQRGGQRNEAGDVQGAHTELPDRTKGRDSTMGELQTDSTASSGLADQARTAGAEQIVAQSATAGEGVDASGTVDAAKVDDLAKDLAQAEISTELPLVELSRPDASSQDEAGAKTASTSTVPAGEYFIRATQGHSIKLESVAHLEPVKDDGDGRRRAGECVHGTKWELWDTLSELSSYLSVDIAP